MQDPFLFVLGLPGIQFRIELFQLSGFYVIKNLHGWDRIKKLNWYSLLALSTQKKRLPNYDKEKSTTQEPRFRPLRLQASGLGLGVWGLGFRV